MSLPMSLRGRLRALVATSLRLRALRRESQKIGGGDAGWKDGLAAGGELLDCGGVRPALAEGRLPGAVIDALAQTFECPLARQAREGLRHGGRKEGRGSLQAAIGVRRRVRCAGGPKPRCGLDGSSVGAELLTCPVSNPVV